MNVSQGFRLREFKMRLQIFITWRQASLRSGARQDLNLQKGKPPLLQQQQWDVQGCGRFPLIERNNIKSASLFQGPILAALYSSANRVLGLKIGFFFFLLTGALSTRSYALVPQKKKKIPVLSYQRPPSFRGKNGLDLIISVKHIPAGPCGQISSVHKWQNNGEWNYKTLSSRAIKSSTRIWHASPVLCEGSIRSPWMVVLRPCVSHWHSKALVRTTMPGTGPLNISPRFVLLWYVDAN